MGHVPRNSRQFGITTVGGMHADASGDAYEYRLHWNQSNELYYDRGEGAAKNGPASPLAHLPRVIPGYGGHLPSAASAGAHAALGASAYSLNGLERCRRGQPEPCETEQLRLQETLLTRERGMCNSSGRVDAAGMSVRGRVGKPVPGYAGYVSARGYAEMWAGDALPRSETADAYMA